MTERPAGDRPARVLFLCTHNSARSQLAEALLRTLGGRRFEAFSAGTVATAVRPEAIAVLAEVGIDATGQTSKSIDDLPDMPFDIVATVCDAANAACPAFPGRVRRLHWPVDDPARVTGDEAARLAAFRAARDTLRGRIEIELLSFGITPPAREVLP